MASFIIEGDEPRYDRTLPAVDTHDKLIRVFEEPRARRNPVISAHRAVGSLHCHYCGADGERRKPQRKDDARELVPVEGLEEQSECVDVISCERRISAALGYRRRVGRPSGRKASA